MITLVQIAEYFENGLNEELNEPNIKFHIWADVGKFDKPFRDGNKVTTYITGNLRTNSSSNDANYLVMGTNGLSLDFSIPVKRPRTTPVRTEEDAQSLNEVADGQYQFVNQVVAAINRYFQKAQSFTLFDEAKDENGNLVNGDEYSLSFQAGTSVSGVADILSQLGNHVTASVYIQLYFVKGGIISNKVQVTFDNVPVPYQNIQFGRGNVMERDMYAENLVSKSLSTSSAFSIDVKFPANSDKITKETLGFLFSGKPNTAHFVSVKPGEGEEQTYLMTVESPQLAVAGITIAGVSAALVEVVDEISALSFPAEFQVGRFVFDNSQANSITFTVSDIDSKPVECKAFIAGTARKMSGTQEVPLLAGDFEYDEETGKYYVYMITDRRIKVPSAPVAFQIVKEAQNDE